MDDIGNKIYERRKELGLTLEEVGQAVGVGRSTVQRWEKGMIKNMGRDKIAALAKVLKMSPVEFVPGYTQQFHPDVIKMVEARINQSEPRRLYATDSMPEGLQDPADQDLYELLKAWKVATPKQKKAIIRVIKAIGEEE